MADAAATDHTSLSNSVDTMPELYDSLSASAVAVRRTAGLASLTGPDRVSWLQGMVSNDVARLVPGSGCWAAHLNAKGRVLSLMRVLADEDTLWLELDQNVAESVAELDKLLIMEDAQIVDRSDETCIVTVVGANARASLEACLGSSLKLETAYQHRQFGTRRVVRGDIGYDLIVPAADVDSVLEGLKGYGVGVGTDELWNMLTLEAGLPTYGIDVDDRTTLPELGEKGIDYQKGCYIGQEVVAKIKYLGHVNRHFVGFRISGDHIPESGAPVRAGERDVGRITRAGYSPGLDGIIALGYIGRGHEPAGTQVEIGLDDQTRKADVSALPFVTRPL